MGTTRMPCPVGWPRHEQARDLDLLGWLGTGVLGVVPALAPGDRARDYRSMWQVAFTGGWPDNGPLPGPAKTLRRIAGSDSVPPFLTPDAVAGGRQAHRARPT